MSRQPDAKSLLMVAFHFPPLAASSGIQRTVAFARYLSEAGWRPLVLSVHPRVYGARDEDHVGALAAGVVVRRAFGLDAARHLSLFRKYPAWLARPDRWISWWLGAVPAGLNLIRRHRPVAIWSTYPIATAHVIGGTLQRLTGLPWIADFRDPLAQPDYPPDPAIRKMYRRIERSTVHRAAACVFATRGTAATYRARYPEVSARFHLIENGYDEEAFADIEPGLQPRALNPGRVTLLHSGIVYASERDPGPMMVALGRLKRSGRVSAQTLQLRFRAPVHWRHLVELARANDVVDLVQVEWALPYRQALTEMLHADGLLLLQGANCNEQVPAKLYEYLRAGRPILALTDPGGDTARVLREFGLDAAAPLESADAIEAALAQFLDRLRAGSSSLPTPSALERYSRKAQTVLLADLLAQVTACEPRPAATRGA